MQTKQPPATRAVRASAILLGITLSLIALSLEALSDRSPAPKPIDAPASDFSAHRAMAILRELLAEGVPHPVGTPENKRVKDRIITRLQALGLLVEEQQALGCSHTQPQCAAVENVVARIPGRRTGPAVLLMAHYDSVPASMGAVDDGTSVATLLELARVLAAEAPLDSPIVLAFTDGEEAWMLGAEAFFAEHPWSKELGVVVNLEGSGSEGPSQILRIADHSDFVVDAFGDTATRPKGTSVLTEVFRLLPNDSDFSIASRAGLPGVEIAIVGERSHYHTSLDSVDNASLTSLQHHGENTLALIKRLASIPLGHHASGNKTFHAMFGRVWISWHEDVSVWLVIGCLFLLALATHRLVASGAASYRGVGAGFGVAVAVLLAVLLANAAVYVVLWKALDTPIDWPANPWPFRLSYAAASVAATLVVVRGLGRFVAFWPSTLGAWFLWLLVAGTTTILVPGAANLYIAPTLAAGVVLVAVANAKRFAYRKEAVGVLGLLLATPTTLGLTPMQESGIGYSMVFAAFHSLALYAVHLTPLLCERAAGDKRRITTWSLAASVSIVAVSLSLAVLLPLRSPWRPQGVNIIHLENADTGRAHWMAWSRNPIFQPVPLPASMLAATRWSVAPSAIPWAPNTDAPLAEAPSEHAPAPVLTVRSTSTTAKGRRLDLHFSSPRRAGSGMVLVPEDAAVRAIAINGLSVSFRPSTWARVYYGASGYYLVHMRGVPPEGFELALELGSTAPVEVFVIDWNSLLPETAKPLLDARGPLATAIHLGDQSMVYTRVSL